jgi:phospholipase D1/2
MFSFFGSASSPNDMIVSYSRDSEYPQFLPHRSNSEVGDDCWALPSEIIRRNCSLKLYRDAHSLDDSNTCYSDMYNAIENAQQIIYITGWSLDVNTRLKPTDPNSKTLGQLLIDKSKQGVDVYIMLWKVKGFHDIVNTLNYPTKKFFKKTQVKFAMWHSDTNRFIYSMHQKILICDTPTNSVVGFVGGLDMTFGRYDTPEHPMFREKEHDRQNATKAKLLSDILTPRQPWHDVHCKVMGPVVSDLMSHFCMRWKSVKKEQPKRGNNLDFSPDPHDGQWSAQMLLSYKDSTLLCRSIEHAYIHAISKSRKFVYIESQYLIGGSKMWAESLSQDGNAVVHKKDVAPNGVPTELVNRIVRAIENNEEFRVYIIIPWHPEGSTFPEKDFAVTKIMHLEYLTIQMMYKEIGKALGDNPRPDKRPTDYLFVGCLGKVERIPIFDVMAKNMIYVHSKMMIVDDEYIILGSANLNERSLSGQRDGEICIGAWQPIGSTQIQTCRKELFKEHFGVEISELDPSSVECIRQVSALATENRDCFKNMRVFRDNTHIMAQSFTVDRDGTITAEILDDVDGYRVLFSGYISKWAHDDFLCA